MDMKIFNNMDTYFDVYACLAQKPRAKNELQDFLLNKGKPKSTVKTHVAKAEKGDLGFVTNNNGQLRFETEQFKETITQLCKEMGPVLMESDLLPFAMSIWSSGVLLLMKSMRWQ